MPVRDDSTPRSGPYHPAISEVSSRPDASSGQMDISGQPPLPASDGAPAAQHPFDMDVNGGLMLGGFLRDLVKQHQDIAPVITVNNQEHRAHISAHSLAGTANIGAQMLNGELLVEGVQGDLREPHHIRYEEKHDLPPVTLALKITGRADWTNLRGRAFHAQGNDELWFQSGRQCPQLATMYPGDWRQFRLSILRPMVERWLADGVLQDDTRRLLEQCLRPHHPGIMQVHAMTPEMIATVRQVHPLIARLKPMEPMSQAQLLQLEGLVLTLLGQWLLLVLRPRLENHRRERWRRAVDDAIDILNSEYGTDLSIGKLARRVGINECYLKQGFRERTGMGIAAYLRRQRMKAALALLEEGQWSVKKIAHYVGYHSPGYFSLAFRTMYGRLPSEVHPRMRGAGASSGHEDGTA